METIQYSLGNHTCDDRYHGINPTDSLNIVDPVLKVSLDEFDINCVKSYGKKTCTFYPLDRENIEIKFLDTLSCRYVKRKEMYTMIPELLELSYTVVILIKIKKTGKKEITAIHTPSIE